MLIMYNGWLSCMGENVAARSRAVVRIEVRGALPEFSYMTLLFQYWTHRKRYRVLMKKAMIPCCQRRERLVTSRVKICFYRRQPQIVLRKSFPNPL